MNLKRSKIFMAVIFMIATAGAGHAIVSQESLKTAFIFRFLSYIEWVDHQENFYVCIPEDEALRTLAQEAMNGKKANDRTVIVTAATDNCHILITDNVPETNTILTIGPLAKGAILEFRLEDNKLRFAVSINNMKKSQLKLSSQLLKLAIVENGNSS